MVSDRKYLFMTNIFDNLFVSFKNIRQPNKQGLYLYSGNERFRSEVNYFLDQHLGAFHLEH